MLIASGVIWILRPDGQGSLLTDDEITGTYRISRIDNTTPYVWGIPLQAKAGRRGILRSIRVLDKPAEVDIIRVTRLRYSEFGSGIGTARLPLTPAPGHVLRTYPAEGTTLSADSDEFIVVEFRSRSAVAGQLSGVEVSYTENDRLYRTTIPARLEIGVPAPDQ